MTRYTIDDFVVEDHEDIDDDKDYVPSDCDSEDHTVSECDSVDDVPLAVRRRQRSRRHETQKNNNQLKMKEVALQNSYYGVCDRCKLWRCLSVLFDDGKRKIVVGCICAEHIRREGF